MTLITYKPEILIIDDSEQIGESLGAIIKHLGYPFRFFTDPLDAISYFEIEQNPIVFLDIHLPGKNGMELLPLFKKINPKTQVIMITGERDINAVMFCLANRASDFILKPFSIDTIEKTIERVLENYNILKDRENYQETLERDIRFTSRIQRQIIFPSKLDEEYYIDFFPISSVSGNFYHIIPINEDKTLIIFGNVEGVGVTSGFIALFTISIVKDIIKEEIVPSEILFRVNNELYYKLNVHTLTMACYLIDQKEKNIIFSIGGTPEPILLSRSNPEPIYLKSSKVNILGIMPNTQFENSSIAYEKGNILFIYNEGFFNSSKVELSTKFKTLISELQTEIRNCKSLEPLVSKLEIFIDFIRSKYLQQRDIGLILKML